MVIKAPTPAEYAEAVARGMALLDEKRPGWIDRIDLDTLVMHDPRHCVVGQEFRDDIEDDEVYTDGLIALGIGTPGGEEKFGFDGWDCDALEAEWRRAITERRSAG
jgi:hypothetical protein